jgi:hypothetical protein
MFRINVMLFAEKTTSFIVKGQKKKQQRNRKKKEHRQFPHAHKLAK